MHLYGKQRAHTHTPHTPHTHTWQVVPLACSGCIFNCVLHIWIVFIYLNSQLHFSHYFCYYTDAFNDAIAGLGVCVCVCPCVYAHYLCIGGWLCQLVACVFAAFLCIFKGAEQTVVYLSLSLPLFVHYYCLFCLQQRVNMPARCCVYAAYT